LINYFLVLIFLNGYIDEKQNNRFIFFKSDKREDTLKMKTIQIYLFIYFQA